jgi:hypothetical protein
VREGVHPTCGIILSGFRLLRLIRSIRSIRIHIVLMSVRAGVAVWSSAPDSSINN